MQWELRGDRPIYQQLVEKLTEQIVSGQLAAGEKVPPVRELAAQAGVNPNTMQPVSYTHLVVPQGTFSCPSGNSPWRTLR